MHRYTVHKKWSKVTVTVYVPYINSAACRGKGVKKKKKKKKRRLYKFKKKKK